MNAECVPKSQYMPQSDVPKPPKLKEYQEKVQLWGLAEDDFCIENLGSLFLTSIHGKTWWEKNLWLLASPTLPWILAVWGNLSKVQPYVCKPPQTQTLNGGSNWTLTKLTNIFKPMKWVSKSHEPKKCKTCWFQCCLEATMGNMTVSCVPLSCSLLNVSVYCGFLILSHNLLVFWGLVLFILQFEVCILSWFCLPTSP